MPKAPAKPAPMPHEAPRSHRLRCPATLRTRPPWSSATPPPTSTSTWPRSPAGARSAPWPSTTYSAPPPAAPRARKSNCNLPSRPLRHRPQPPHLLLQRPSLLERPGVQASPAAPAAPKPAAPASAAPAGAPKPGEELVKHQPSALPSPRTPASRPSLLPMSPPCGTSTSRRSRPIVPRTKRSSPPPASTSHSQLTLSRPSSRAYARVPAANSSYSEEGVIIKRYYNIGMATALPMDAYGLGGLIVPVIKNAGDLNLMGLAGRQRTRRARPQ